MIFQESRKTFWIKDQLKFRLVPASKLVSCTDIVLSVKAHIYSIHFQSKHLKSGRKLHQILYISTKW